MAHTPTTRLAPSPTGALHLGNVRTFVVNYLLARREGWRVLMRVEDLDGPRVKAGAAADMIEQLAWLGLEWDGPIVYQSARSQAYRAALEKLVGGGWAYPCVCSRRDIELAGGAPHGDDGVSLYPGTCRGRFASADQAAATGRPVAWRLAAPSEEIAFADRFAGPSRFNLARTCGDFVIFKSDGLAAYQLAVVVDDAEAGVDRVVRGDDLLESAARQIYLRRLLEIDDEVEYVHLPLVVGPDGRRLAKRHGDTRLSHYRDRGATREKVLGLMGYWCGLFESRREADMNDLLQRFDLERMGREKIVFSGEDDKFLSDH